MKKTKIDPPDDNLYSEKVNPAAALPSTTTQAGRIYGNRIARNQKQRLTVKELSDYLGVSVKTIYGWTYRGLIPFEKIGPHLIRFDVEKIEKWISDQPKGSP